MKKNLLFVAVLLLTLSIPNIVFSHEWITTYQATVSWEPVTEFTNGQPIPVDDTIEYVIYLVEEDSETREGFCDLWFTAETEYTISFEKEGRFFVGLKTLRKDFDGVLLSESVVGWSDDPLIVKDGETFGIRYFYTPLAPCGFKPGTTVETEN